MPALNRVELIGYLGHDPEARFIPNGKKYASFSIAISRTWKSADGEQQKATDWFRVNAWGKLGEICLDYLKKGRLVFIEGRLRSERWEDKESGETRSRVIVVASGMQMLDRKPGDSVEPVEEVGEVDTLPEVEASEPLPA